MGVDVVKKEKGKLDLVPTVTVLCQNVEAAYEKR